MKLIVDRKMMLRNVERAKQMCSSPIALIFKDFYADMYDSRFSEFNCFSNDQHTVFDVTVNIGNPLKSKGKVITSLNELEKHGNYIEYLYVPINYLDNREGVSISKAKEIFQQFNNAKSAFAMLTSGCLNDLSPTYEQIEEINDALFYQIAGVSVGGSYYLQHSLPPCVKEVRIGEYMLFGTIPYCNKRELFNYPAIILLMEVLEVYPERKQILLEGGTSTINANDSIMMSGGLQYSNASCDYTIYNDPFGKYKVGDIIEMIPDYYSLKLLRNVAREYT